MVFSPFIIKGKESTIPLFIIPPTNSEKSTFIEEKVFVTHIKMTIRSQYLTIIACILRK